MLYAGKMNKTVDYQVKWKNSATQDKCYVFLRMQNWGLKNTWKQKGHSIRKSGTVDGDEMAKIV
jgi:hypothetical protein